MKSILLLSWVLLGPMFVDAPRNEVYLAYIEEYKDIAILEMERTGVPASIKLAQGLLESNAGQSDLAKSANNHFGIKCGSFWEENYKKDCYYKEDDEYDHRGKKKKSCFRKYEHAEECFIAHSDFLRDPRKAHRYGRLFDLDPKDYVGWAHGLRAAGYATDPKYPNKLISVIENYHLYKYDYKAMAGDEIELVNTADPVEDKKKRPLRVVTINSVSAVYAREGDTPWYIAEETETSIDHVIKYNEHIDSKVGELEKGTIVFLQKKRKRYLGRRSYHYVKPGDRMLDIATQYGIVLESLYKRNRMPEGMEPLPGEKIYIRKKRKKDNPPAYTDPENLEVPTPSKEQKDPPEMDELITYGDEAEEKKPEGNSESEARERIPAVEETSHEALGRKVSQAGAVSNANDTHLDFALAVGEVIDGPVGEDPRDVNRVLRLTPAMDQTVPGRKPDENTEDQSDVMTFDIVMEPEDDAHEKVNINQSPTAQYYEVQPGDTLFAIYRNTGTPVSELRNLNNLPSNVIHPGDILRVK